jgi:hypothetical protein
MTLVCAVPDAETAKVCARWTEQPALTARLIVRTVRPVGLPALEALARDIEAEVADGPYAMLAVGSAVRVATDLMTLLRTTSPVTRLFVARAVPPLDGPAVALDGPSVAPGVPVGVLCGARDPVAPPRLMGGWRAHCGDGFAVQVLDGGADFLRTRADQVVHGIVEDLRIQPVQVPGRGFAAIGGGLW